MKIICEYCTYGRPLRDKRRGYCSMRTKDGWLRTQRGEWCEWNKPQTILDLMKKQVNK